MRRRRFVLERVAVGKGRAVHQRLAAASNVSSVSATIATKSGSSRASTVVMTTRITHGADRRPCPGIILPGRVSTIAFWMSAPVFFDVPPGAVNSMADPDPPQHEADASPEPHAGDDSQQPATPKRSWRPNVWLATVSTAVAVATGMFTLRDKIFPPEAGNATASIGQYQQSVGDICRELNEADRAGARSARRFAAKLKRARTTLAERNAVLDSRRAVLTRSERGLAHFEGLNVPRALLALQRVTVAAWNRGVERLRDFTGLRG
jgi:hypothetical protein